MYQASCLFFLIDIFMLCSSITLIPKFLFSVAKKSVQKISLDVWYELISYLRLSEQIWTPGSSDFIMLWVVEMEISCPNLDK